MQFRTELALAPFSFQLSHQDVLLSIGSCFTEHIGERFISLKFNYLQNPFGIVYNPISLAEQLEWLESGRLVQSSDLFENQGLWHSWAHHGSFSGLDKNDTLANMNNRLREAQARFASVSRLFITLGTAQVFVWKATGAIVANCHKMPGQLFTKRRLAVEEIVRKFEPILKKLKAQNGDLQVIFTVSPVRHLRDGLVENQKSKATLLLAIDKIGQTFDFVHYFPAYELILDDLRDYRFFNADMIHPNEVAVGYVWERLRAAFFTPATQELIRRIEAIVQAGQHRPFHPQSALHQAFVQKQLQKIQQLEAAYPFLNFAAEKNTLQNKDVAHS